MYKITGNSGYFEMVEKYLDITPISAYVIKIASRCNLNCSYCYEYNMGDESWKKMPKYMSEDIFKKTLNRIKEHSHFHDFTNLNISFHGGEPLLVGHERILRYFELTREILSGYQLNIGVQSNGILIDREYLEIFEDFNVSIGISLDGLPKDNDKFRYYHNGRGSGNKVAEKLSMIENSPLFGGILSVINITSDPVKTWRYLASFNPPVIDFLLPHAHWDNVRSEEINNISDYGNWLISIFEDWYQGYRSDIRIRFFEEIIYRIFGYPGALESLGLEEVSLITIGLNGDYEQVDTMKSVYPGANCTDLNVDHNSLNEVLNHQGVIIRQSGISGLCDTCINCEIVSICGGGYYPHRYSSKNGFNNPSVYCDALYSLINHIKDKITTELQPNEKN